MFKNIYKDKDVAYGYVIPKDSPTTIEFLTNLRDYNDISSDIKKQIKLANEIYRWESVCTLAINTSIDFVVTDMSVKGLDSKALDLINHWLKNVNGNSSNMEKGIHAFNSQCALEWFCSGNPFIYENWRTEKIGGKGQSFKIPTEVVLLNPKNIEIPEDSVIFGNKIIKYNLSPEIADLISKKGSKGKLPKEEKSLLDAIPDNIVKNFKEGQVIFQNGEVTHIKRKGRNYLPWGIPYLACAFQAVAHKRKLQLLDQSIMEGLIQRITIFKIGDLKEPKSWNPGKLRQFKNLIDNPSPSKMLVWGPDLSVEDVVPDASVLDFENKYKQADRDIIYALGIPADIIVGAKSGDQFVTIAAFMERLSELRSSLETYLINTIIKILTENNLYKDQNIEIFWKHSRLRNAREIRDLVLTLWDRGLISIRTALEESGQDIDVETPRKEEEKPIQKLYTPPQNPFVSTGPQKQKMDPKDQKNTKSPGPTTEVTAKLKDGTDEFFELLVASAIDDISSTENNIDVFVKTELLTKRIEMFIKNMLINASNVGITIDDTLEAAIEEQRDSLLAKIRDLDDKELIREEIKLYGKSVSDIIDSSLSLEVVED